MQVQQQKKHESFTHALKCEDKYFIALVRGEKTFEIRKNDRDYRVGDRLHLWEISSNRETGRHAEFVITYMTDYEQKPGYVVMSVKWMH